MHKIDKAIILRNKIKETWNPPIEGSGDIIDVAQLSSMITLAWIYGKDFLEDLTTTQEAAIDSGLTTLESQLT